MHFDKTLIARSVVVDDDGGGGGGVVVVAGVVVVSGHCFSCLDVFVKLCLDAMLVEA